MPTPTSQEQMRNTDGAWLFFPCVKSPASNGHSAGREDGAVTMTDHTKRTHPGGCPCAGCNAERAELERCLSVLRNAGEIPAEASDAS